MRLMQNKEMSFGNRDMSRHDAHMHDVQITRVSPNYRLG